MEVPALPRAPTPPVARLDRLRLLHEALAEAVALPRVAAAVVEHAVAATGAAAGALALVGDDGGLRVLAPDPAPALPAAPFDPVEAAVRERRLVRMPARGVAAWLAVPLTARRRTWGAVALAFHPPRDVDAEDEAFLAALGTVAAVAVERAQILEAERRALADAEEAERRLRALVQELGAIFWEGDARTFQFDFVSNRAVDILGYPLERWREPGFWVSILHPEDREWAANFCIACTRDGHDHAFDYRLVAADGRVVWVRDVVYVVRDAAGEPTRLRGVMVEIEAPPSATPPRQRVLARRAV